MNIIVNKNIIFLPIGNLRTTFVVRVKVPLINILLTSSRNLLNYADANIINPLYLI